MLIGGQTDCILLMLVELNWGTGRRAEDVRGCWQDRAGRCQLIDRVPEPVGGIQLDERIGPKNVLLKQFRFNKLPNLVIGDREKAPDVPLVVPNYAGMQFKDARGSNRTPILYS
jgi:hypothetical protein